MDDERFLFGTFAIDPRNRRLLDNGEPVNLANRYLDTLVLMVREQGSLVTKDRFMDEVWRGVPVTDEALTQCIRTLRKALGDDAANPRYIETVPKHGYRFIAPVSREGGAGAQDTTIADAGSSRWRDFFVLGGFGTLGGLVAGLVGGLAYGFDATAQPLQPGVGAISIVLVLVAVTALVASIGAAGVAFGIATARLVAPARTSWSVLGGALGGLVVGGVVKLLGVDAFDLMFGQSPGNITGGAEGLALGGAVGVAAWLALWRYAHLGWRRGLALAAAIGGAAGLTIPLLGGRMMAGSLDLLGEQFPNSRLRFEQLGRLFGESDFGIVSQAVTGMLEGALFAACVVGAMLWAQRRFIAAGAPSPRRP